MFWVQCVLSIPHGRLDKPRRASNVFSRGWGVATVSHSIPVTHHWRQLPTTGSPPARCDHVAAIYGSRMLIFGGGQNPPFRFSDAHILDLSPLGPPLSASAVAPNAATVPTVAPAAPVPPRMILSGAVAAAAAAVAAAAAAAGGGAPGSTSVGAAPLPPGLVGTGVGGVAGIAGQPSVVAVAR